MKSKYIYLSHAITSSIPVYGNPAMEVEITPIKQICNGDSCHTYAFKIENHWGTHMDSPNHFFEEGETLTEMEPGEIIFTNIQVLEIQCPEGFLITSKHLGTSIQENTDLLLIKTGMEECRGQERYSCGNPGMSEESGLYLRENCPNLRAIGFDFISLSSFQNREEGRRAHQSYLDPNAHGRPILIIEDMALANISSATRIKSIVAAPLRIAGIDSGPVTVIAEFADRMDVTDAG